MAVHAGKRRRADKAIAAVIDYVADKNKTENGRLITSYQCNPQIADAEFLLSKRQYAEITGLERDNDVIAYHVRQSFKPGEITPEEANKIGYEFASRFLKGNHAFIVCTHVDKRHIHNHITWNSTTLDSKRKFRDFHRSGKAVRELSDTICVEHGKSIIEKPKRTTKRYDRWQAANRKLPHQEIVSQFLKAILDVKPKDLDELLELFRRKGFDVRVRGNSISIKVADWKRFVRLDSLGKCYTVTALEDMLSGKSSAAPYEKVELLIDIDAKLREGKGSGYRYWTSVFNAKQTAKAINFLRDNRITDFDDLIRRTDEATTKCNELSAKMQAAEKRLAEIQILKTHIINYRKTKAVFDEYKAKKYSKKFYAEHESEIMLHRAAKKTFNEYGLKKLPTIKSLQDEYGELYARKKSDYSEFIAARDEMRHLQKIKYAAGKLLYSDEEIVQKENEHDR